MHHSTSPAHQASAGTPTILVHTRGPDEIFEKGFEPWGNDMDLMGHATGENYATSGYVSTSLDRTVAEGFGPNVYAIRTGKGVEVNRVLGSKSPFPREAEIAVPGGVRPGCILGCTLPSGRWIPNPGYGR
ncbi:scabin-related ADP-ribosyltransferase [Fodinicola acaciae]|uniref:scabin-related ADP-ribosyltransferase n=1 Tax=Fodinicola acaciae TaxID=2681555 RepID=UPI0013D45F7E